MSAHVFYPKGQTLVGHVIEIGRIIEADVRHKQAYIYIDAIPFIPMVAGIGFTQILIRRSQGVLPSIGTIIIAWYYHRPRAQLGHKPSPGPLVLEVATKMQGRTLKLVVARQCR